MNKGKIVALITRSRISSCYILNGFYKIHVINEIIMVTLYVWLILIHIHVRISFNFDTHTCKFSAFLLISKHLSWIVWVKI